MEKEEICNFGQRFVECINKGQLIEATSWYRRLCVTGCKAQFWFEDQQGNKIEAGENKPEEVKRE